MKTFLKIPIDTNNKARNLKYCGQGCRYLFSINGLHVCILFHADYRVHPTEKTALKITKQGYPVRHDECLASEDGRREFVKGGENHVG